MRFFCFNFSNLVKSKPERICREKYSDALHDLVPFVQFKKNVKNTHEAEACNFTKSNTPPWLFFMFFKLYKRYQIAQRITYIDLGKSAQSIILLNVYEREMYCTSLLVFEWHLEW